MFLNLKDENSGRVERRGVDRRLVSGVGFGGGIGELDDAAAVEKPFMNFLKSIQPNFPCN